MQLPGSPGQQRPDYTYDASGTSTGSAQLILPQAKSRSMLIIQNISDTDMYVEMGSARGTATISGGKVTSIAIANAGFNFTYPPLVSILGGGADSNALYLSAGMPGWDSPSNVAQAHCTLSGGAVNAITVDNGGAGYVKAPYVFIYNDPRDPFGCADPSTSIGFLLKASGGNLYMNMTSCTTDSISLFCGSSSKKFTCKYMV